MGGGGGGGGGRDGLSLALGPRAQVRAPVARRGPGLCHGEMRPCRRHPLVRSHDERPSTTTCFLRPPRISARDHSMPCGIRRMRGTAFGVRQGQQCVAAHRGQFRQHRRIQQQRMDRVRARTGQMLLHAQAEYFRTQRAMDRPFLPPRRLEAHLPHMRDHGQDIGAAQRREACLIGAGLVRIVVIEHSTAQTQQDQCGIQRCCERCERAGRAGEAASRGDGADVAYGA